MRIYFSADARDEVEALMASLGRKFAMRLNSNASSWIRLAVLAAATVLLLAQGVPARAADMAARTDAIPPPPG